MQVGPVNHAVWKTVSGARQIAQWHADDLFSSAHVVHGQACRKKGHFADHVGQSQPGEHPENIRTELNARTDFAEAGRLLQHGHGVAVTRQHEGGGQAANAAADDENGKGRGHGDLWRATAKRGCWVNDKYAYYLRPW